MQPQMITFDLAIAENRCIQEDISAVVQDCVQKSLKSSVSSLFLMSYWWAHVHTHANATTQHLSYNKNIRGDPALLDALSNIFNNSFNPSIPVLPEHIGLSAGASICLTSLIQTLCQPRDSVLIPAPYWSTCSISNIPFSAQQAT